jgi:hypothetical protein
MVVFNIKEKKVKKNILVLFLLLSINCFAVLSPFYQSTKEIETILKDNRLSDEINQNDEILEIKKVEDGYLIFTKQYLIKAKVNYIPTNLIGPQSFEIEFENKIEL